MPFIPYMLRCWFMAHNKRLNNYRYMDRSENKSTIDRFLNHLLRLRPCVSGDPIRSVPLRSPWHQRGPRRTQSWSTVLSRWTLMTSMYCYKVSSYTCFGYFIFLCSQMDYQWFRHLQHTQENWISLCGRVCAFLLRLFSHARVTWSTARLLSWDSIARAKGFKKSKQEDMVWHS